MKIYVGLAVADSMFPECCTVTRRDADLSFVLELLASTEVPEGNATLVNCCNSSHKATLEALRGRYRIDLSATIREKPPTVKMNVGDMLIVLSVRGLPRLTDRHEYTAEEIAGATFSFGLWNVLS